MARSVAGISLTNRGRLLSVGIALLTLGLVMQYPAHASRSSHRSVASTEVVRTGSVGSAKSFPSAGRDVSSDFNGDGFADLAVGVPFEDGGGISDAGAVTILYGSAGGLQATAPDDQLWSQGTPEVSGGAEAGDQFGSSLTSADFNGDGFADLAVGVPFEDVRTVADAGAVNVLYGSAAGLQATSPDDQLWSQSTQGLTDIAEAGDQFGSSLSSADFNGDGFADLAVGVPLEDESGRLDAGAVNVIYGSAAGLQTNSPDDQFWHQDSPGVADEIETGDQLGSSLAAGDFNGDGFADLTIGVPFEDGRRRSSDAGTANVLYGSPAGLQAIGPEDVLLTYDEQGAQFGSSLTAADFNGDSIADLAVGIPFEDPIGRTHDVGAVVVLYGSTTGLQPSFSGSQLFWQKPPSVKGVAEEDDQFGSSLAAADLNGDGFADLAVGVPFEDIESSAADDAGSVNVFYGSAAGLQATSPDDQLWKQDSRGVKDSAEAADSFGSSLAGADFNGDGFGDLSVGVPFEDVGAAEEADAGAANVLYGSMNGLQAMSPDDQFWNQDSPGVIDAADPFDEFGGSLTNE